METNKKNTIELTDYKPNILHLLKISLPNLSGYSIRSHYILLNQKKFARTYAITNPYLFRKDKPDIYENVIYYRYPSNLKLVTYRDSLFSKYFMISRFENILNYSLIKTPLPYLRMIVKQKKIDLIHGHTNERFAKLGEKVAHEKNIPFVYEIRGFWEDSQVGAGRLKSNGIQYMNMRRKETRLMKKADALITLGKMMKKELITRGIDKEKIYIIPNAVDLKYFQPNPPDPNLKRKLGINEKYIIAYIGSIREIEGLETLIKAVAIIKKQIKNIILLLIGSHYNESYRLKLEWLINNLGIDKNVHFTGQIQQKDLKNYYYIIDIIVIPRKNSRVTRLVTPLKQLEAMAMQKVVVTSDLAALRETIKPGISGDIFKAEDSNSLASKIIQYLFDKELRNRLGESARTFVQKNYDWELIIKKYQVLYKKLLEQFH